MRNVTTRLVRLAFAGVSISLAVASPTIVAGAADRDRGRFAVAQGYGRQFGDGFGEPSQAAEQQDSAGLLLRIDRLESQVRQLTGQLEQLQFAHRKLQEQLEKFQQDVDFRLQEGAGRSGAPVPPAAKPLQRRSEIDDPGPSSGAHAVEGGAATVAQEILRPSTRPARRGDAFDPASDPDAPGAPRPLGTLAPSPPLDPAAQPKAAPRQGGSRAAEADDPDAPLDLSGGKLRPPVATMPEAVQARSTGDAARDEFDRGLALLKQKEYEGAEKSFAAFLQKNPKSKLASEAVYHLGESFYLRGRQREAAEQYLKVSTQYGTSARAPDALLRLGQSLSALGAKEQACATYAEIARKYPNASASVKSGAEREARRAQC